VKQFSKTAFNRFKLNLTDSSAVDLTEETNAMRRIIATLKLFPAAKILTALSLMSLKDNGSAARDLSVILATSVSTKFSPSE
jgi:hypothetical protein